MHWSRDSSSYSGGVKEALSVTSFVDKSNILKCRYNGISKIHDRSTNMELNSRLCWAERTRSSITHPLTSKYSRLDQTHFLSDQTFRKSHDGRIIAFIIIIQFDILSYLGKRIQLINIYFTGESDDYKSNPGFSSGWNIFDWAFNQIFSYLTIIDHTWVKKGLNKR